jgi:hypothetical protein
MLQNSMLYGGLGLLGLRGVALCLQLAGLSLLLSDAHELRAASFKPKWDPVSAKELADMAPAVEAGVAAEAIFNRIEIDDKNYPLRRVYRYYSRFKIYDPGRLSELLTSRLLSWGDRSNGEVQMAARLHLLSGETKEFGKESFLERTTAIKSGERSWWWAEKSIELKEKYLAISGVERGAILEYYVEDRKKGEPDEEFFPLQMPEVPARQVSLTYLFDKQSRRGDPPRVFFLDEGLSRLLGAKYERKENSILITAQNIPSILEEPFAGPETDYSLTVAIGNNELTRLSNMWNSYSRNMVDKKESYGAFGPWTAMAAGHFLQEKEKVKLTKRVKNQAAALTGDAKTEHEMAERIHYFVSKLRREYALFAETAQLKEVADELSSPDDVLDYRAKKRFFYDDDFFMLALSLCRAAKLEAKTIILPDRTVMRFSPNRHLFSYFTDRAVGIQIDGRWHFSFPHTEMPLPFDMLRWNNEGQSALVAHASRQEFIHIPAPEPDRSTLAHTGAFKLTEDGRVSGECRATFTGHFAVPLRASLRAEDEPARKKRVTDILKTHFPTCKIQILAIEGLEGIEEPLAIRYSLEIEGYASFTKEMIVVKPAIFRSGTRAPFSSPVRRSPVVMPFRWQERDDVTLEIPEGFILSEAFAPPSYPGEILNMTSKLFFNPARHRLSAQREFTSGAFEVGVTAYEMFKRWHDAVANSDQHELAFKRKPAEVTASAPMAGAAN